MKQVRVLIERGEDGTYGAYMPDDDGLDYCVIGDGATAEAAVNDFNGVYEAMKASAQAEGRQFEEVSFAFAYDLPSFLQYYANLISYKGLARMTGIAPAQLSQYVSGYRHPSAKTTAKIQQSLHDLGKELSQLQLI